jgi:cell division transport system permease protein
LTTLKYYLRDAGEGLWRNVSAAVAAVSLIFISLSITGALYLLQSSVVDEALGYLDSQVKMKLFIDPSAPTEQVANVLKSKSFTQSVEIETKQMALERLKLFFQGKQYLFEAFQSSSFPDTILLELKNKNDTAVVAEQLRTVPGISDVFYAQQFAQTALSVSEAAGRYGVMVVCLFLLASILTVSMTMKLALFQRAKEIRVKLLLGAKEAHVKGQFMFEGFVLGLLGSLAAGFVIYLLFYYVLYQLELHVQSIFQFNRQELLISLLGLIGLGTFIGLIGSFLSVRRVMRHE